MAKSRSTPHLASGLVDAHDPWTEELLIDNLGGRAFNALWVVEPTV
jgi:hypothetical protein